MRGRTVATTKETMLFLMEQRDNCMRQLRK